MSALGEFELCPFLACDHGSVYKNEVDHFRARSSRYIIHICGTQFNGMSHMDYTMLQLTKGTTKPILSSYTHCACV